jgi:hypothetical protein
MAAHQQTCQQPGPQTSPQTSSQTSPQTSEQKNAALLELAAAYRGADLAHRGHGAAPMTPNSDALLRAIGARFAVSLTDAVGALPHNCARIRDGPPTQVLEWGAAGLLAPAIREYVALRGFSVSFQSGPGESSTTRMRRYEFSVDGSKFVIIRGLGPDEEVPAWITQEEMDRRVGALFVA